MQIRAHLVATGVLLIMVSSLGVAPVIGATSKPSPHVISPTITPKTLVTYESSRADGWEFVRNWGPAENVQAGWTGQELDVNDDSEMILFSPPAGQSIVVGTTYTGAGGSLTAAHPGLWHVPAISSCVSSFTVHDIVMGPPDAFGGNPVTRLSLSFTEVCGSAPSWTNYGEIRLASADPVRAISTYAATPTLEAPVFVTPPTSVPGRAASASMTVTNVGDANVTLGAPAISQAAGGPWTVTADTCSTAPLVPGAACTVSVSFMSWSPLDDLADSMTLATSTDRGSLFVPLTGNKMAAPLVPLVPNRIVDSRIGLGFNGPLPKDHGQAFAVTGRAPGDITRNVPADALAVVGNLTVTGQTAPGYLSLTTDPTNAPTTSSLNFADGHGLANGIVVRLSASGTLGVTYVSSVPGATAQVVFDVTGYYAGGVAPGAQVGPGYGCGGIDGFTTRLLDTRHGIGLSGPFTAGVPRTLPIALPGVINYATALFGNLTVVSPTSAGYLAVTPDVPVGTPTTSTLNFSARDIRANNFVSVRGPGGALTITFVGAPGATAQVILDVVADCAPGGAAGFVPLNPSRIVDSRIGLRLTGPLMPGSANIVSTDGLYPADPSRNIPSDYAETSRILGYAGNVTMIAGAGGGFLTVEANNLNPPPNSGVNAPASTVRANGFVTLVGGGAAGINVFVYFGGALTARSQVVVDSAGYFWLTN